MTHDEVGTLLNNEIPDAKDIVFRAFAGEVNVLYIDLLDNFEGYFGDTITNHYKDLSVDLNTQKGRLSLRAWEAELVKEAWMDYIKLGGPK